MEKKIPRPEYPRPQFERKSWMNLNGDWDFEMDNERSGLDKGYEKANHCLKGKIVVPFCPESKLSGVCHKDFMLGLWYQKKVELTKNQIKNRVFLHFGAVDYECFVYVNGEKAGYHKGGYVSFSFEITGLVKEGCNVITVNAQDDSRDPMIPRGKQSERFYSHGCDYTRTTGIWQTVWLEFVPQNYIENIRYETNIHTGLLTMKCALCGTEDLSVQVSFQGKTVAEAFLDSASGTQTVAVTVKNPVLWNPGKGNLYEVLLTFGKDKVKSYTAFRSVSFDGYKFLLNDKPVFQRLILDQGFYPDGIYTAPSDSELAKDIDRSMALGFNGARLHEKIFEERFLYYCDKKGYLVWGEYPNWGLDHTNPEAIYSILPEWIEEMNRDMNHPSIIGWCPFNETWNKKAKPQFDDLIRMIYKVTKAIDPYRPCIDTSGNYHVETGIYDVHDYIQDPERFKENYDRLVTDDELFEYALEPSGLAKESHRRTLSMTYQKGMPVFVSEFGGIRWSKEQAENAKEKVGSDVNRKGSWGYGKDVESKEEFLTRWKGLIDALLDNRKMFGFCYTQLTDVEQEENGLYTYDRVCKFDPKWMKKVISRKAAIEE